MAYIIDRLVQAGSLSSMQPVETLGRDTRKRAACRRARAFALAHPGSWVQVRVAGGGSIVATYTRSRYNDRARKV